MSVQVDEPRQLESVGIAGTTRILWNLSVTQLYEAAIARGEATLAADGWPLC